MTADELRAQLKALGLSQTALAERLGVDHNTVWRWATGALAVPQYAAAYLGLAQARCPHCHLRVSFPES